MAESFVHLHLHTEYSMLDGASRIGEVVAAAAADGQPAVGITDHGNMYGALELYKAAENAGHQAGARHGGLLHEHVALRPAEAQRARDLPPHDARRDRAGLPQPDQGHEPRVPRRLLLQAALRLGAARDLPRGHHRHHRLPRRPRLAADPARRRRALRSRRRRASRTSSGASTSSSSSRTTASKTTPRSSGRCSTSPASCSAPLLATNDSHYTTKEHAEAHDALLCVQTGALQSDPNRLKFDGDDFYIKSAAEMRHVFREAPEACDNTLLIAERADVELEFGNAILPSFPVPEGHDENSYLRELTIAGAQERYGTPTLRPHVRERIDFELDVIKSMGFSAYFLVVWDLVRYAKSRGIRVGPGRGSAAGSCVAYCLRIVDIDPIRYDLLFERFLNPGRKEMPDIDMDFDSRYRGEMIRYAAREVRRRPRRADRHVLDDQGAGRGARRGAGARLPVRGRRQDRQADAAARDGPRHAAARVLRRSRRSTPTATRWRASCGSCTTTIPTRAAIIDVARRPRRPPPPGRHPRRGRRDHARPAHRVPPDPAQARAGHAASRSHRSSRSTR